MVKSDSISIREYNFWLGNIAFDMC